MLRRGGTQKIARGGDKRLSLKKFKKKTLAIDSKHSLNEHKDDCLSSFLILIINNV